MIHLNLKMTNLAGYNFILIMSLVEFYRCWASWLNWLNFTLNGTLFTTVFIVRESVVLQENY